MVIFLLPAEGRLHSLGWPKGKHRWIQKEGSKKPKSTHSKQPRTPSKLLNLTYMSYKTKAEQSLFGLHFYHQARFYAVSNTLLPKHFYFWPSRRKYNESMMWKKIMKYLIHRWFEGRWFHTHFAAIPFSAMISYWQFWVLKRALLRGATHYVQLNSEPTTCLHLTLLTTKCV